MLVYGDRWRAVAPGRMLLDVAEAIRAADATCGCERLDRLTHALILAGELAQGVADADLEAMGVDDPAPAPTAAMTLAVAVAGRLLAAAGQPAPNAPDLGAARAALGAMRLPRSLRCKTPEGYAFYAVYPESYAAAAAAHAWRGTPLAIGLRCIGTSLAAAVAARVGGDALTLRPVGHPFRRELRPSPALAARLAAHDGPFAVVDEGPGLSGSSFGAVADLLERLGVPAGRIVFMPSHAGDLGRHAAPAHRARWTRATRLPADGAPAGADVARWFSDLTGPALRIEDVSAGAWRAPGRSMPPAAPAAERRKIRLTTATGRHVARFAGLGEIGERKFGVARGLHAAGFAPAPLALRRGFLLEAWVDGDRLGPADCRTPEALAHIARYLGHRARALPALASDGADLAALVEMAATNAAELAGADLGRRTRARLAGMGSLTSLASVRVDGRLHPWEWLRRPCGALLKTDALDHAAAHDLVGCQDIAWDVAGAAVEFALAEDMTETLRTAVGAEAGRRVNPEAVAAFRICYAAFQAGLWSMAGEAAPAEAARTRRRRDAYVAVLRRLVAPADGPDSG